MMMMMNDTTPREARIRQAAQRLWQEAGSPAGQDLAFWLQAEADIAAVEASDHPELLKPQPPAHAWTETAEIVVPAEEAKAPPPPRGWRQHFQAWWEYPANRNKG